MDSDIAVYLISYELKSPALGSLPLSGWCEGWAALKFAFPFFQHTSIKLSSVIMRLMSAFGLGRLDGCRVDSIAGMTSQVPTLRKKFVSDPEYFKKVYKYVFDLGKVEGAKVVGQHHLLPFQIAFGLRC
jgi:hypothetical protein